MAATQLSSQIYGSKNNMASSDFKSYLEQSLKDPFTINLKHYNLIEIILACAKSKSKMHPKYRESLNCLIYNLQQLQETYKITLQSVQVTDIFWGYFISFCQDRGLKTTTIITLCNQLRSILNWAVKYNANVSPTYNDLRIPKANSYEIALTADEVSRIAYFDIDRFYNKQRRKDFIKCTHKVRDMFVLSCNLYQRYSDMVRISPECFDHNIFRITQQKTGAIATVNIDKFSVNPKTTYKILEKYNYFAPFQGDIGNYNFRIHELMRDIGFTEMIRVEEKINGTLVVQNIPKWKMISSHTARRTAITINVLRGHNVHDLRRCSGHADLGVFDRYIRDEP